MQEGQSIEIKESESRLLELLVPFMGCYPPFGFTAGDRCLSRGLLPGHLLDCLHVLDFLSVTVLSAQKAQRAYGVRASVLLAMAIDECGFEVRDLARDPELLQEDYDNNRLISPRVDQWFMNRAKRFATKRFQKALQCVSLEGCVDLICELGFGDSMKAKDLWANIESYHLDDCDRAGMLPIGEYDSGAYSAVRDDRGNLRSVKESPYRQILQTVHNGESAA